MSTKKYVLLVGILLVWVPAFAAAVLQPLPFDAVPNVSDDMHYQATSPAQFNGNQQGQAPVSSVQPENVAAKPASQGYVWPILIFIGAIILGGILVWFFEWYNRPIA